MLLRHGRASLSGVAGGAPGYEPSEPSEELERSIFAAPSGPEAVCGRVMLMWCMSAMLDCGGEHCLAVSLHSHVALNNVALLT